MQAFQNNQKRVTAICANNQFQVIGRYMLRTTFSYLSSLIKEQVKAAQSTFGWRRLLAIMMVICALFNLSAKATLKYWGGAGTWTTANTWSLTSGGTLNQTWASGDTAQFDVANSTVTFASTTVGDCTINQNLTVTAGGTWTMGGVRTITVASGKLFDSAGQNFSTGAGGGFIKAGSGAWISANGNAYPGGFTLSSGSFICGGVNAMGNGGALNLNGGALGASGTRNITTRYSGINVGGDFQIGVLSSAVSVSSDSANITFADAVALGAATRTITIGANGTYTFGGIISGSAGSGLTINILSGASGNITLTGANNYTGDTTINGGTLKLSTGGSIASSPNISIAGGATLDVSGLTTALTLASGQNLKTSGSSIAGTIATASGKGLTLASSGTASTLSFSAYDGSHAPLTITGAGTLTLASGNPVTVTVPGSALTAGDYKLVAKGSGNTTAVGGTAPTSVTVNGAGGLAAGTTATLVISGGELFLHVVSSVTYTVTYNGNGNTGGTAPVDGNSPYGSGSTVTVLGAGTLTKTGYTFAGWNTATDGSGTSYATGATFSIAANTTLYAQWTINTYTVTYNANGGTGSQTDPSSPYNYNSAVTVLGVGSIVRTGYTFTGWNTAANGSGISYNPSDTFTISANTTLYAQWTINSYTLTYDGNGNDGGSAPSPVTQNYNTTTTVSGAGTLTKSGSSFSGWNTVSGGSGTSYSAGNTFTFTANTTLFAQWSTTPTITLSGTLSVVNTTYGAASASPTSFTVSGVNLTGDLTATPPSGFEVSLSSGSGYTTSLTIPASGTLASTPVYVRLLATATVSGSPYSGNVTVSGGGATSQTIATASSTVAQAPLTITGLTGKNKVYDRTTTATTNTTDVAIYSGLVNGETFSVSGTPTFAFSSFTVGTAKNITVSGYIAPSGNYSLTQPTLTADITPFALTVTGAGVTNKVYNGTIAATITNVNLVGVISPDLVTNVFAVSNGYFASPNVGSGIAVTATITLGGDNATNYSLTQPTGLAGNITKANQTITFGALPSKTTTDAPFALTATASSGLTVTYASDNPAVATVSGSTVTIVGAGTATITASQAGDGNYNAATDKTQALTVTAPVLAGWDASGVTGDAALAPNATAANATVGNLTAGSGLGAGAAANGWGANGWNVASEALAISGNKFATFTVKGNTGYRLNLNALSKFFYKTSGTGPPNGALQYSLDGSTFTEINNSLSYAPLNGSASFSSIDLSGIAALQNLPSSKTVTFRIVNWGASASAGTWYVNNGNSSGSDLEITGTITPNNAPVGVAKSLSTSKNTAATVIVAKLLAGATDPDGDTLSVTGVSSPSAHGTVTLNPGVSITYTPTTGYSGSDSFTFTISDGSGGTVDVPMSVTVVDPSNPSTGGNNGSNLVIRDLGGGVMRIFIVGTPNVTYQLQHSGDLTLWTNFVPAFVMPGTGVTNFDDSSGAGSSYYRTALP